MVKIYDDIRIINKTFCNRLANIKIQDASLNAVVILDIFADFIPVSINEDMLGELEYLFNAYF